MIRSNIWTFILWRACRTGLIPLCVLAAMVSMLFSSVAGVLPALETLSPAPAGGDHLSQLGLVVSWSLWIAAVLMLVHTLYLSLMAFHLVYRFPIHQQQWIGLVYVALAFAYIAHAWHGAHPAHDGGWLATEGLSSGAFAVVYVFMLVHGRHPAHEHRRTQLQRASWMRGTDVLMFLVASAMLIVDLHPWRAAEVSAAGGPTSTADGTFLSTLFRQATLKDVFVVIALSAYMLTKIVVRRRLSAEQPERSDEVQRIQSFTSTEADLQPIRARLPPNVPWLDLGSGHGVQAGELLQLMYDSELRQLATVATVNAATQPLAGSAVVTTACPMSVAFLDKDKMALSVAMKQKPPKWPEAITRHPHELELRSDGARRLLQQFQVVHMSHVVYRPKIARAALDLLRHANRGTLLLLRYTSETSFYRVISTSTACAPLRPYIHHHMHPLLLRDLKLRGWKEECSVLLNRTCHIDVPANITSTVDWCDAQYGEFSGDIIERYFKGLRGDGASDVPNCDRLVLLTKVA